MGIYKVYFNGNTDFVKALSSGAHRVMGSSGRHETRSTFNKGIIPGISQSYHIRRTPHERLLDITQKELDSLVEEAGLYNSSGELLRLNKRNPDGADWSDERLRPVLRSDGTDFDDENPLHRLLLAAFRADPYIVFEDDKDYNPLLAKRAKYRAVPITQDKTEQDAEADEVLEAMSFFNNMDFSKKKRILSSMGYTVKKAEPKAVDRILVSLITKEKDRKTSTGERNIDRFMRMANMKDSQLNLKDIITKARKGGVIVKDGSKGYKYGSIVLGSTLDEVFTFLSSKENEMTQRDIIGEVKAKKERLGEDD